MNIPLLIFGAPFALGFAALVWLRLRRAKYVQRTFCYCPGCRRDLVGRAKEKAAQPPGEVVYWYDDHQLIHYVCACTAESCWDFDLAPFPVLLWAIIDGKREEREELDKRYEGGVIK